MKVLYVASEAYPFIKTGGLADVAGSLPIALKEAGASVSVVLPYYQDIPKEMKDSLEFVDKLWVNLSWRRQYVGVFKGVYKGVDYYFLDNLYYFGRKGLYGHYDDAERFAYFDRAVLEALPLLGGIPDIIHANDWQCGMISFFLDKFYRSRPEYQNIRTVYTIHNIEYQGIFDPAITEDILGLDYTDYSNGAIRHDNCVNYMKAGIRSSSWVSTVSPSYAKEILTPQYGKGMESILNDCSEKLSGILNGIDLEVNNPLHDEGLFFNYCGRNLAAGKANNKKALQEMLGLPVRDVPMIAIISRLVEHKGMGLVARVLDGILAEDIQFVVIGTGDWKYEEMFRRYASTYPGKCAVNISFNTSLASKLYAAADYLLMPSLTEPCGLSQMNAMRYACIPIVHETGGLKDSVVPFWEDTEEGNGFSFADANAYDMLYVIREAISLYYRPEKLAALRRNAYKTDFSWKKSAQEYMALYKKLVPKI